MSANQSRPHTLRRAIAVALTLLAIGLGCAFGQSFGYRPVPTMPHVSLAWNPSPGAAGYRVYFGPVPGAQTNYFNVGNVTSCSLALPGTGRQYFYVMAYDDWGLCSGPSNEVWYPGTPNALVSVSFLTSTNLADWSEFMPRLNLTNPAGARFWKTGIEQSNWLDYGNP